MILRLFISSVQKEFAAERAALRDYLRGDALLRRFLQPFLLEEDMIERCRKAGLAEPEFTLTDGFVITLRRKPEKAFQKVGGRMTAVVTRSATGQVTPPVTPPVEVLVRLLAQAGPLGNAEIRARLGLKDRTHLWERYLDPALAEGFIEPTIPDKPNSRLQKYRLTAKGSALFPR